MTSIQGHPTLQILFLIYLLTVRRTHTGLRNQSIIPTCRSRIRDVPEVLSQNYFNQFQRWYQADWYNKWETAVPSEVTRRAIDTHQWKMSQLVHQYKIWDDFLNGTVTLVNLGSYMCVRDLICSCIWTHSQKPWLQLATEALRVVRHQGCHIS
jgi:hypothetical protein